MQNDIKQCWFYQMCKKNCAKDVGMIFVGAGLILICLLLFKIVISTYQFIAIALGIFLIVSGFSAFFKKLPKVRESLSAMPPEQLDALGTNPPQAWYKTFYFTDNYLCIPEEYVLIRYIDIINIQIVRKTTNGAETGYSVVLTVAGRSEDLDVAVSDWRSFGTGASQLVEEINNRKLAMREKLQQY